MDVLLSGQLLLATLILGSIYALVAIGLNLIYGAMRLLNVAHGEVVMLGGYVAYWAITLAGIDPLISMFAAMVLAAALGIATYQLLFRRILRSTKLLGRIEANSLLVFFGISVILQNLTSLAFTANERGYPYRDEIVRYVEEARAAGREAVLATASTRAATCSRSE